MAADKALAGLLAAPPLELALVAGPEPKLVMLAASGETLLLTGQLTPEARYGQPTTVFLEVGPQRLACDQSPSGDGLCLQVRETTFDDKGLRVESPGEFQVFSGTIEGYTHQAGTRNVLRVKRFQSVAPYRRCMFRHRDLLSRSAIRVCQPGPVALQRAMTSTGSRMVINFLGLADTGRPPFFTTARESISAVSSGRSPYSAAFVACASTRRRSDFKERRDALFFTAIGFPHAEYVSVLAAGRVPNRHQALRQISVTDDSSLTVVLTEVFDLDGGAGKYQGSVLAVEATLGKCLGALGRVIGNPQGVTVTTLTDGHKARSSESLRPLDVFTHLQPGVGT